MDDKTEEKFLTKKIILGYDREFRVPTQNDLHGFHCASL